MDSTAPTFTANVSPDSGKEIDYKKVFFVLGLLLVGIFVWGYVTSPILTNVTGVGEVSATASNATISFSITANDNSPQAAIAAVNVKAVTMSGYLKTKGIAESDIAQGQVTAVPAALVSQGASGFQATITMAAKTTHVSDISTLISDLYTNGVSVVSQPILSVDNKEALEKEAYDNALKDAKSQAGKIALSNWKLIRKVVAITQTTSGGTSTATTKPDSTETTASPGALTNGVFKISKAVTITYKMW